MRTVVVGTLAYVALIAILRTSGERSLLKMKAFDFVVTVALGSTLATVLLSKDVALAEGVVALSLLILLQFVVTWLSVRFAIVRRLVKSEPTLLLYRGEAIPRALIDQRISEDEIRSAARSAGVAQLSDVTAVVLETDGSISVVPSSAAADGNAFHGLKVPTMAEKRSPWIRVDLSTSAFSVGVR